MKKVKKNYSNGHLAATIIPLLSHGNAVMPCMVTTPQHDSDDESSDDDSADSHEDSTEGEEKMKRRRNLLHRHLLKTKSWTRRLDNMTPRQTTTPPPSYSSSDDETSDDDLAESVDKSLQYYLIRYRNLYRFSQQGWEALNQKIKRYWHSNTNKGGNVGGNST
jgi:hypothetical protein